MQSDIKTLTFNRLPILGTPKVKYDEWKFSFDHWCSTFKVTEESEKIDYLFALTDKTARTIVYNSLSKTTPDGFEDIMKNLAKHYKKTTAKNSKILELSSIMIRKDETITDFDLRFTDILNQVSKTVTMSDVVISSYYINAFRNWTKIYESLMEEEPVTLEDAMKITGKKEKVMNLIKENNGKKNASKEKYSTDTTRKYKENSPNDYSKKYYPSSSQNYKGKNQFNSNTYANSNGNYRVNNFRNNTNGTNNYQNKSNENNQKQKLNGDDIEAITQRLSDLKISFCVNCMRVGHTEEECMEEENQNHLN